MTGITVLAFFGEPAILSWLEQSGAAGPQWQLQLHVICYATMLVPSKSGAVNGSEYGSY